MKKIDNILCKTFEWSRYRFRLWKKLEDIPRDFNHWRKICFKHRIEQSLCHCKEEKYHFAVTPKIAIPKKNDKKGWIKLENNLKEHGDNPEANFSYGLIPMILLNKNERLLYKTVGKIPERNFYKS